MLRRPNFCLQLCCRSAETLQERQTLCSFATWLQLCCRSAETLQILFAPTHPQPIKGFGLHIRLLQIHSAALLRSLHNCTPTCNLRIVFRVALPTISIHCCWLKNKRKIQIGSHITAIQPTLFCSLMLGVHMVAVEGSLVLFTGPCQPVNGQLLLLLPALTMVHSPIVFWALWF